MERRRRNKNFGTTHIRNSKPASSDTRSYGILPAPGILESYEEIAPGSVEKILSMVANEQGHRHKWENNYLKIMAYNNRVGQLLAFILSIIIIYTSIAFVMAHDVVFACIIAVLGFAFLITLVISSSASRRSMGKPYRQEGEKRS